MAREFQVDPPIPGKRESQRVDAAIAVLAARQHGVVSRLQLLRIGLTRHEIDERIAAGRLHPLHRGVYAVGHRRITREGRYLAAVLATDGTLSHCAAADLWELRATKEREIDVIAPTHRRGDPRIRVHAHAVDRSETTRRLGIPITKPQRTLLDLAAVVTERELDRAIRQAVYRRMTTTALLPMQFANVKGTAA